jgi:hypothetical protein
MADLVPAHITAVRHYPTISTALVTYLWSAPKEVVSDVLIMVADEPEFFASATLESLRKPYTFLDGEVWFCLVRRVGFLKAKTVVYRVEEYHPWTE